MSYFIFLCFVAQPFTDFYKALIVFHYFYLFEPHMSKIQHMFTCIKMVDQYYNTSS